MAFKRKIEITPDNIDDIYQKVNELIDEYFDGKYSIRPTALKRYLKAGSPGMKKFIARNNLNEIQRIEKVILDVVQDRAAMEKDGVIKFENFDWKAIQESFHQKEDISSLIFSNIDDSDDSYEKVVADFFRTSLGHIETISKENHMYDVNTLGYNAQVVILSEDDVDKVAEGIRNHVFEYLKAKLIQINYLNLEFDMGKILNDSNKQEIEESLDKGKILEIISEVLQNNEFEKSFKESSWKGYYIWKK